MSRAVDPPAELLARRANECRLIAARWLTSVDEARAFLVDRRMLSLSFSGFVPSLFGACAPNPDPRARGFATLPPDKWWWGGALCEFPEVRRTRLLRGKVLLLVADLFEAIAPLCLAELSRAEEGALGRDAQVLVTHLDQAGPQLLSDLKAALGLPAPAMARLRQQLETVGAVLSEDVEVPARNGQGHLHTSRVLRFDQAAGIAPPPTDRVQHPNPAGGTDTARTDRRTYLVPAEGLDTDVPEVAHAYQRLLSSAVGAAVLAPRADVERWFTWPARAAIDSLLIDGILTVPAPGWLALSVSP